MSQILLAQANSLHVPLADQSVHMVCTSPPYFGVRDYGTQTWEGGDQSCDHIEKQSARNDVTTARLAERAALYGTGQVAGSHVSPLYYKERCGHCGAVRRDEQLGLERVHDCGAWARGEPPCGQSCYICHMRTVAKELWRVLRNDGTLWINIADTYAGSWGAQSRPNGNDIGSTLQGGSMLSARQIQAHPRGTTHVGSLKHTPGIKAKSLCGIPQRLALALQSDGWVWRSDIVWHKPSCMPESVQDRPTRSHEYILLFSKQAKYFYDGMAIQERGSESPRTKEGYAGESAVQRKQRGHENYMGTDGTRNSRTVWTIPSEPFTGRHYATFPTALAERMVRAGTSAHGVCHQCGAPWGRVVERETGEVANYRGSSFTNGKTHDARASLAPVGQQPRTVLTTTTGWRPTCPHPDAPVVPAIVLDPFAGSATTLLAARALGRQAIGLDLSWPYLYTIARERLGLADLARWHGTAAVPAPVRYDDLPLFVQEA